MRKTIYILLCNFLICFSAFAWKSGEVLIGNCRPGNLEELIVQAGYTLSEVRKMTVAGKINVVDILTVVHKMEQLEELDLNKASIVAGKYILPVVGRKTIRRNKANELTFGLRIVDVFPGGKEIPKKLEKIVLPENLEVLSDGVFSGDKERYSLLSGEIRLPSKLKYIGVDVFAGTDISYAVPLPESLEYIGSGRILCKGTLLLPSKLSFLNARQLDCPHVTDFVLPKKNREFTVVEGVLFSKDRSVLIAFPKGRSGKYIVPSFVKRIEDAAFYKCDALTEVDLNDRLQTIGTDAFVGCDQLRVVYSKGNKELADQLRDVYDFNVK